MHTIILSSFDIFLKNIDSQIILMAYLNLLYEQNEDGLNTF